jgi:hypothetical protein
MVNWRLAGGIHRFIVNDMRPLWAVVIHIAVVFVGGALLAPWLYWFASIFAREFPKIVAEPFNIPR